MTDVAQPGPPRHQRLLTRKKLRMVLREIKDMLEDLAESNERKTHRQVSHDECGRGKPYLGIYLTTSPDHVDAMDRSLPHPIKTTTHWNTREEVGW